MGGRSKISGFEIMPELVSGLHLLLQIPQKDADII
jgi:hypothetical protein